MRTQILILAMTAAALATPVRASDCPDCVLGLYADSLLTQTTVNPGGDSLVLWVGMRYGGFTPPELTGVEFSIAGLELFTVTTHALGPPAIVLGEPAAPTGLDTLTLAGGVNAAWSYCVPGEQALLRLTLRPRTNWPQSALLRVTNRFPPSNPELRAPLFTQCDDPVFTTTTVRGGSFVVEHERDPHCEVDAATDFGVALVGANLTLPITITNRGGGLLSGVVSEACDEFEIAATDLGYELGNLQSRTFDFRFRPTTPGIKTCALALGSSCGDLTFTATVPELVTVAMIRDDIDAFADHIVTIEGQVIVPSTHRSPPLFGWLRDGSGRGIQVWAPGLTDLGDRLRVTARVTRADRSIRLQPIVFLDVLDGGHPPIAPTPLAMAALRDPIWSGDLVQIRGRAVQLTVLGDEWRYQLDDDTAEVTLVVSSGRFPSAPFRVGDLIVATGAVEPAAGVGTLVYMRDGRAGACPGPGVTVADAQGSLGAILSVPLRTSGVALPVDAFRLRIAYTPEVVRFRGASGCGVTADWTVGVDSLAPDTVLVWGQGGTPVPQFASETLACLDLEMVGCLPRRSWLVPHALADEIENAWACPGEVICSDCPSTGDVNGDGTLTPGDAQCAFAIFMHEHMVPLDCDAAGGCELAAADFDCNGDVTPLDALEVFRSWLADQTTPRQCGAALARRPAAPRAAGGGVYLIDVDHARAAGGDRFEVDVERLELDGDTAFGADVRSGGEKCSAMLRSICAKNGS